jgi:hypothetical protein
MEKSPDNEHQKSRQLNVAFMHSNLHGSKLYTNPDNGSKSSVKWNHAYYNQHDIMCLVIIPHEKSHQFLRAMKVSRNA